MPGKESAAMEQETLAVPHDTCSRPSKYQGNHHLGEWRLHPKVVQGILDKCGLANVDLFALEVNGRPWTAEIVQLLYSGPWYLPQPRDFLSLAGWRIFHPHPQRWNLGVWPVIGLT